MEKHGEAVGATDSGCLCLFKQGGLSSAVNGVIDEMARFQEPVGKGGGIACFHAEGSGVDNEIRTGEGLSDLARIEGDGSCVPAEALVDLLC